MFKIIRVKFLKSFSFLLAVALGSLGFSACYGIQPVYILPSKASFNSAADCAIGKTTDAAKKASLQAAKDAADKISDEDWLAKASAPEIAGYLLDFAAVDPSCKP